MSELFDDHIENESGQLVHEYMERAARARATGEKLLGLHLFLAAYGQSSDGTGAPSSEGVSALREAWALALQLKERALAEYIFEQLGPTLSEDEYRSCTDSLQGLTLDKLEEFGLSRKELEEVSGLIAQELQSAQAQMTPPESFPGMDMFASLPIKGFSMMPGVPFPGFMPQEMPASAKDEPKGGVATQDKAQEKAETPEGEQNDDAPQGEAPSGEAPKSGEGDAKPKVKIALAKLPLPLAPEIDFQPPALRYEDLAGFAHAIRQAKALGVGSFRNPGYGELVQRLNAAHGFTAPPALETLLMTSPIREDATRFAFATAGELDLPIFRMFVENNPGGIQVLCVTAQQNTSFKFDRKNNQFEGRGMLVLEDVDLWDIPAPTEGCDEAMNHLVAMQMARSVREVFNFVRAAVENPNIVVVATAESEEDISPFFLSVLGPYRTIDIDMPTPGERASIWVQLVGEHPSLAGMSVANLVKNSANMGRYDIYMAVEDTLEEAYRADLQFGEYRPIKAARLFEKLAQYQPVESEEYKVLEDAILADFRSDLAHIDDLLNE